MVTTVCPSVVLDDQTATWLCWRLTVSSPDIEVLVATTLWNKLIEVWPAIYGGFEKQLIGLLGPVTLTYVQDVTVLTSHLLGYL